ncbi:MAG: sugar transferase [Patescibacteria group bacterium]|nr:sugar transferase [Patescibacteria group bacterium]
MKILLFVSDMVATVAAFFVAYAIRNVGPLRNTFDTIHQPFGVYLAALPVAVALLLLILRLRGLYHPRSRMYTGQEVLMVIQSVTLWALLIAAGSYFVKYDYSRVIVTLFWLTTIFAVSFGRFLVGRFALHLAEDSALCTNVIIVGTGRPAKTIARQLQQYFRHGYRLIGFVGGNGGTEPTLGPLADLPQLLKTHRISQVYCVEPSLAYRQVLDLINGCPKSDVEFLITANIFPHLGHTTLPYELGTIPSLDLKKARPTTIYRMAKRAMDLTAGAAGLIVSSPLWLAIAWAIKSDSPGPVIIRQTRVGKDGHTFTLYKFRTMVAETNTYAPAPQSNNDQRITRIGRILRRFSLDELPQFLNVVRGEMSLVGPRPEMPFIVQHYEEWQKRRLAVKPGLTGLWQILGRKDLPLHDNLEYDFYYVNNQSLLLDLEILVRTVPQIIFGKGAY